jgi:hypothetical protein
MKLALLVFTIILYLTLFVFTGRGRIVMIPVTTGASIGLLIALRCGGLPILQAGYVLAGGFIFGWLVLKLLHR